MGHTPIRPAAARWLVAVALALVLVAPVASARSAPVLYFLKDAPGGSPASDGILEPYDPLKRNVPNGTQPHSRFVIAGQDQAMPVRFGTPGSHEHPTRLLGQLFMGLWLAPSSTVKGNLTVTLYEVPRGGAAPAVPGLPALPPAAAPRALASATLALDADPSQAPNATALVPPWQPNPTPPTPDPADPQGSVNRTVAHEQGQALALAFYEAGQVSPILLKPPAILNMGIVDITVNATSDLVVAFKLDAGSSPASAPLGAFGQINYDYLLGPSYLFTPWYEPDAPRATPPVAPPLPPVSNGGHSDSHTAQSSSSHSPKKTPGIEPVLMLVALAALAVMVRRKMA